MNLSLICLIGTSGVISNFVNHLRLKHLDSYNKYKNIKIGNSDVVSVQEIFNSKILNFIADSALPVSIVDRQSFINLFDGTKVMSRQTAV